MRLGDYIEELCEKTNINNQYEVLTSSQNGIVSQKDYFNKQVASENNIGYKIIKKGEFTYRSMSDTGLFYINQLINYEIGIVSPAYPVFRISNNNLDPEFLQFYFQSSKFQHQICNQSTGSTRLALKFRKLASLDISIPSLIKQKKIICNLKTFKNAIKIEEKQLFLLDELIKSRFNEMFGNPIDNPHNFKVNYLSNLGYLSRGKSKHRPRNDPKLLGGPYPLIQTGDVKQADLYISHYESTYSEFGLNQSKLWPKGTLCITIAANIAETAILKFDACFPDSVVGFIANEKANTIFIRYQIEALKEFLNSKATEVAQKNLNIEKLESVQFMTPEINPQNEFASFVEQVDKLKFVVHSRYFLCEILTLFSSTIAYSRVVSILACPNIF